MAADPDWIIQLTATLGLIGSLPLASKPLSVLAVFYFIGF